MAYCEDDDKTVMLFSSVFSSQRMHVFTQVIVRDLIGDDALTGVRLPVETI